jgi:hypothetical protein
VQKYYESGSLIDQFMRKHSKGVAATPEEDAALDREIRKRVGGCGSVSQHMKCRRCRTIRRSSMRKRVGAWCTGGVTAPCCTILGTTGVTTGAGWVWVVGGWCHMLYHTRQNLGYHRW